MMLHSPLEVFVFMAPLFGAVLRVVPLKRAWGKGWLVTLQMGLYFSLFLWQLISGLQGGEISISLTLLIIFLTSLSFFSIEIWSLGKNNVKNEGEFFSPFLNLLVIILEVVLLIGL